MRWELVSEEEAGPRELWEGGLGSAARGPSWVEQGFMPTWPHFRVLPLAPPPPMGLGQRATRVLVPTCCVLWSKPGTLLYPDFPTSKTGPCRVSGMLGGGVSGSRKRPGVEGRPGLFLLLPGPCATTKSFLTWPHWPALWPSQAGTEQVLAAQDPRLWAVD